MPNINIKGTIGPSEHAFFYHWFGIPYADPDSVENALNAAGGQPVDVYVNSNGGEISAGGAIYTLIRKYDEAYHNVKIHILGAAHSAASIISMSAWCEMAPTALMMVHCVSSYASGNHNVMEQQAEVLRTADDALCTAYVNKSGMSREDALAMMNAETWFTAEQALSRGLIDKVMFSDDAAQPLVNVASGDYSEPTPEQLDYVREMISKGIMSAENITTGQAELEPVPETPTNLPFSNHELERLELDALESRNRRFLTGNIKG